MKKYILILSIAVIAVLNFTLVKSKTGDITLKSITELAQANADSEHPNLPICSARTKTGSYILYGGFQLCSTCGYFGHIDSHWDMFTNYNRYYLWDGKQYNSTEYVFNGEAEVERWFICDREGTNGTHDKLIWQRVPTLKYYNDCNY